MIKLAVFAALILGFSTAEGVIINDTYDLNGTGSQALDGGTVTLSSGDHVDVNVDFLGNQSLTVGSGNSQLRLWLLMATGNSIFTINNVVVNLLGFTGTGGAQSTYNLGTVSSGQAHIGPDLNLFFTATQSATFTGYSVSYDIASIAASPSTYSSTWLIRSGNTTVGTAVPDGGTTAIMLGLSLGTIGVMRRKLDFARA